MLHVTFTRDFREPGAPLGYVAVQAEKYFAAWQHFEPDTVAIHRADGDGLALLTLKLGGELEFDDGSRLELGPVTPVNLDELRQEETSRDWAGSGSCREQLAMRFAGASPEVELELRFHADRVELNWRQQFNPPCRVRQIKLAAGTRIEAAEVVNAGSNSTGIHRYALNRPLYIRPDWFTPPPFCYAYRLREGGALGVSVEEGPGCMAFTRFLTDPDCCGAQAWRIRFDSAPRFSGAWSSPTLVFRFGATDAYDAFRGYAEGMVAAGKAQRPQRRIPDWWRGVMLCGWLYQCYDARGRELSGSVNCTEELYRRLIRRVEEQGIDYDILTVDAWWGEVFGLWREDRRRWPDLKGFIASEHARGKHVLVWLCPNVPGLPEQETYVDDTGKVLADPLNPAWRQRVRESLRYLLAELDFDGIKFDFTEVMPGGLMRQGTRELHGLDYLYELFRLMHDAAREAKPEALLDFQVAHPVFAGLHDMSRLNDYFMAPEQALRVMRHRAEVAHAVTFGALVDTDCPCSADYFRRSWEFGNVSMYLSEEELRDPELCRALREGIAASRRR